MNIIKKDLDIDFIKKWMKVGLDPIVLSILCRRDITEEKDILNTLFPLFENIFSPFKFNDIITAYKRIETAIQNKEKIIIFGDRDVDGTTSIVILYNFIKTQGGLAEWEVPISDDPYGLNIDKLSSWIDNYSLCITVDCGITNIEEVHYLKKNNIDTIIIDHHEPLGNVPEAVAIINPKNEPELTFINMAACGVTFLFIYGYLFYKSSLFNEKIGLMYKSGNYINLNIYSNLVKIDEKKLEYIDNIEINSYYDIYYYDDGSIDKKKAELLLEKNVKILKPIYYIYNNEVIKSISDINLKAHISLINELLKDIENLEEIKSQFLPLAMLGTIADLMPLTGTNRIISYIGLEYFKRNNLKNIRMLCDFLNINPKEITSKEISWYLCPLLNAPGRMGDATLTIGFLNSSKEENLVKKIVEVNEERKEKGENAYNTFFEEMEKNMYKYDNNLAFFYSENLESGITGVTATKLSKRANCPIIVAAKQGKYYTGSIRGESSYHFVDFLEKGSDILTQYGGHKSAAGFRFHENELETFKNFLTENSFLFSPEEKEEEIIIDAEIPVKYLNYDLYSLLSILEPFGINNQNPILYTPSINIYNYTRMGKEKQHLKVYFDIKPTPFIGIYWNKGEWFEKNYEYNKQYDVIYQLDINKYNGQINLQMLILYLKKSEL